jgi:peptidoglycan/LPS O-acetylase OafA/YrhL
MRRVPELDALRGIAAVMVLSLHLGLDHDYAVLASAVDMFFVLSGYLITRIIVEHETGRGFLIPFYARRMLRIWPTYYALLIGFVVVNRFLPHHQPTRGLAYHLTFTQFLPRYWFARPPRFCMYFNHTWTLAAEEQFYLLWPLLAVWLGRRRLVATIPILLASAFAARLWFWPMLLITNWDGFALGALLAWVLGEAGSPQARRRPVFLGLAVLGLAALFYPAGRASIETWITTAWPGGWPRLLLALDSTRMMWLHFAVVGLVISGAGHPLLRPLRHPALCYCGTISYGLYLYHHPLYAMISPSHYYPICRDSMALDAVKLAATFALAVLSWEFLEKPILRLKDRFPYPAPALRSSAVPAPHWTSGSAWTQSSNFSIEIGSRAGNRQ